MPLERGDRVSSKPKEEDMNDATCQFLHRRLPAYSLIAVGVLFLAPAWAQQENAPLDGPEGEATETTVEEEGGAPEVVPDPDVAPESNVTPTPDVAPEPDPSPGEEKKGVEEIVVTGSRIGRSNLDEYAHITVLSSEQIQLSGTATIDDLLTIQPSVTLQGVNKQRNYQGFGLATVDLRNLGPSRTLVLVNGRRFVKSGQGGEGVDMNNIPVAMIERVEVLHDGASAIYGSDAVGGVVNIILKKDFEGFQVDMGGGITTHGDAEDFSLSATMGGNHDRGNMLANLSFYHREPIAQKDREWAEYPYVAEFFDPDGNLIRIRGSSFVPSGHVIVPGEEGPEHYLFVENDGKSYKPWGDEEDRYNYATNMWLMGRNTRYSLTIAGNYELSENINSYIEGTYTHRKSVTQLAPEPVGSGTAAFPGAVPVPTDNPYLPDDFREDILTDDIENIYMMRRMVEINNRVWDTNANTFRMVLGLEGEFLEDFNWDVYANYGKNRNHIINNGAINLARLMETLDPDLCAQNANRGCVVGDYFGAGDVQDEVIDYIRIDEQTTTEWDMMEVGATLGGRLFRLPGGHFAAVIGGDARWESGYNLPDSVTAAGDTSGNVIKKTEGDYNAQEVFVEVSAPLLKDMPGVDVLTIDLAGRFSAYDTFGSQFTYRAGMSWGPIPDLRLRGVFSTAFRAPSINDLYGGNADLWENFMDPCTEWENSDNDVLQQNCEDQGVPQGWRQSYEQIRTVIGSNSELEAETSKNFNVGLVFTPTFLPKDIGASLTADFYNIIVDNGITTLNHIYLMEECYNSQGMGHEYCQYVQARNPVTHDIQGLDARKLNVNQINTSGLDFALAVNFPIWQTLRGSAAWNANYLIKYHEENTDSGVVEEHEGKIRGERGSMTHLRWTANVGLHGESWQWNNRLRYIGAADFFEVSDPSTKDTSSVPVVVYWDMSGRYTFGELNLIVGVNNLLDKEPPYMWTEGGQNGNGFTYDFLGRYIYAKIGYTFF